jgi:hypothetical protein
VDPAATPKPDITAREAGAIGAARRWDGHSPNSIRLDTVDPALRRVILALRAAWATASPEEIAEAEALADRAALRAQS